MYGLTFQVLRKNSEDYNKKRRLEPLTTMGTVACDRTSHRTMSFCSVQPRNGKIYVNGAPAGFNEWWYGGNPSYQPPYRRHRLGMAAES